MANKTERETKKSIVEELDLEGELLAKCAKLKLQNFGHVQVPDN